MRVSVVLEHRFERTPDGRVWTDGPFPYTFFTRYLETFESVRVLARVWRVPERRAGRQAASGDGVAFFEVPYYHGAFRYLLRRGAIRRALSQGLEHADPVILRVPSQVAIDAAHLLEAQHRPYAAEVVGDPCDAFAEGSFRHPLRRWMRSYHTRALAAICRSAAATAYVTTNALQQRYPPAPGRTTTNYSSVELQDEAYVETPGAGPESATRLISVGSMEHLYKGHDTLLEAVALCRQDGLDLHLTLVGDGINRPWLEAKAERLGLAAAVTFAGQTPSGQAVRDLLDQADLFVLASRQEGLPRALLEAMARGVPAVSTTVGGIPELLDPDSLVQPDNPWALAELLRAVCADRLRRTQMAALGLAVARRYHDRELEPRRREFYQHVRRLAESDLKRFPEGDDRCAVEPCSKCAPDPQS